MRESLKLNKKSSRKYREFFLPFIYLYYYMETNGEKKIAPMTITHWKNKFNKAIYILLKSGISAEQLIDEIKSAANEKNS
jgi:hypothetical protein